MTFESCPKFEEPFEENKEEKSKIENSPEELEEGERELNPEEIKKLGGEMDEYTQGLKVMIEEIKAKLEAESGQEEIGKLQIELEELQTEYAGLKEMAEDIDKGNFEKITEKPAEK